MRSVVPRVVALVITLLLPCRVLLGQNEATTSGKPSCVNCRIIRIPVATLGARDDAVLLGPSSLIARDSRGRFYASSATSASGPQVAVFDSIGRQVSSFGMRGQGPGELQGVSRLRIGAGDTLYVEHRFVVDVFAPVGRFVRRMFLPPVSGTSDVMPLTGGRLLISTRPANRTLMFQPMFQIADRTGEIVSGFGSADTSCATCFGKLFARSGNGSSVLAAERDAYKVEEWDIAAGRLLKRLTVTPPWFINPTDAGSVLGLARPRSRIGGIARDTGTLVWIAAVTAASDWKPYAGKAPVIRNGLILRSIAERDTAFTNHQRRSLDMVIEVLDLARNTVLVSTRANAVFFGLVEDGLAWEKVEDADGYVRIRVWRFAVRVS